MKIISKRGRAKLQEPLDQVAVLQSCMDPVYFLNNFFRIQHLLQGTTGITLYPYQEEYVRTLLFNNNVIAVMPRQAGATSITLGFLIWEAVLHSDQNIIIGGSSLAAATQICQMMQTGVQLIPAFVRPAVTRLTRNAVQFSNGSSIVIGVCSPNFLRGARPTRIFLDNFANVTAKTQHDTWAALAPCLTGLNCIMSSTPNGVSNTFAKIWEDANAAGSTSAFTPLRKTIADLTQYDAQWRAMMRKALGESAWRSEFECEFS